MFGTRGKAKRAVDVMPGFDPAFYLDRNPDVAEEGVEPLTHFIEHGWREGRDPSAAFSISDYLSRHPELLESGTNPLAHYNAAGSSAAPSAGPAPLHLPGFDAEFYRGAYPDVVENGADPLQHYIEHGWREGRDPSATFSTTAYLIRHPELLEQGINPLEHHERQRNEREGLAPSFLPGFDRDFYRQTYPDVAEQGIDLLQHFLELGWREGRDPSPYFSTSAYLAAYPDVEAAGMNPLVHFVERGLTEGRLLRELRSEVADLRTQLAAARLDTGASAYSAHTKPGEDATLEVLRRIEKKIGEFQNVLSAS